MKASTRKTIQIFIIVLFIAAALRAGWIFYQRAKSNRPAEQRVDRGYSNPDYYVTPRKLHAYDLPSARELTKQPVYVREGYRYAYYPYDRARKRADLEREAGVLAPIEKLNVVDVVKDRSPGNADQEQILAVFEKDGKNYAVPIGASRGDTVQIYADEIFFLQDPRELYKHWPQEIWDAISRGEVTKGMNELQASFAAGVGIPQKTDNPEVKTVRYPRQGKPLTVTYRDGRAIEISQG